jgi:phosphoglycolate phosphatase-like HAD superfamily hydrolase
LIKEKTIVVEDDADGVGAAKKAGLIVVAVASHGKKNLANHADYVIDSLTELTPEFLEKVFRISFTPEN